MANKDIWLDIDLDFFNPSKYPLEDFRELICEHTLRNTHCVIVTERPAILGYVKSAVKKQIIAPKFQIIHIDEHHGMYGNPPQNISVENFANCDNFMYYVDSGWIEEFIWIRNSCSNQYDWLDKAAPYLKDCGIEYCTGNNLWVVMPDEPELIKLVTITVSPNFLAPHVLRNSTKFMDVAKSYYVQTETMGKNKGCEI